MKPLPRQAESEDSLSETLRQDAGVVCDLSFDPVLHRHTIRRIQALKQDRPHGFARGIATAAALSLCVLLVGIYGLPAGAPPSPTSDSVAVVTAPVPESCASAQSYYSAARLGNDSLLAVLDRDARKLLPPSPPVSTYLTD